jgi:flagellin
MGIVGSGNTLTSAVSLVTGDTLGGLLNVHVGGAGFTAQFSDYQGLTSSDAATVTAALTKLGQGLTSWFGDTYTASINSSGKLVIQSNNAATNVFDWGTETETPAGDPVGEELSVDSGYVQQTYSLAPVTTPATFDLSTATGANLQSKLQTALGANYTVAYNSGSGALSITVSSAGALAGITSIAWSNNSAQETSTGTSASVNSMSIDVTGQTGSSLAAYLGGQLGSGYSVSNDGGGGFTISVLSGSSTIAAGTGTATATVAAVPPAISSKVVGLTGVSTANLQSTLLGTMGSDYSVSYDQSSGDLAILLNSGNGDGITSFTSSSTLTQNTGSTPDVNTPSAINLTGVPPANLAASIVSQLGSASGNYDVSYNTSSGALNFGLSSAGAAAGIASISANMSSLVETVPSGTTGLSAFNVFTSDGTGSGTNVDVTVGSLSSANVGTINGQAGADLSASDLLSQSTAASALTAIMSAVKGISSQRGAVGANINRLVATVSVEGTTVVNLTSAMNSIQNADIGKTVANMTQYNVLQSTGMAAVQQANQAQQAVLKLVQ